MKQISPWDINKDKILMFIDKNKSPETKQNTDSEIYKYSQTMLNELATAFN
ncbi:MAG: hypothetical protein PHW82_13305 [Bacteroidales bacterium]|nr:hypothetical protein [Bacteroidales bacterium]